MSKRINGFKFQEEMLDLLQSIYKSSKEHKMTSSALTMMVLLYSKADSTGYIDCRTFTLKKFSESTGIPYTTLHTGLTQLLHMKLVSELSKENDYEIVYYYKINFYKQFKSKIENGEEKALPYFYIPKQLLKLDILKSLVKSKNVDGLFFMLELFKRFSHTQNAIDKTYKYTYNKIVSKLHNYSTKLKQTISVLRSIFNISFGKGKEIKQKIKRDKRKGIFVNSGIDLRFHYYEISLGEEYFKEKDDYEHIHLLSQFETRARDILKESNFNHSNQDIQNMINSVRSEVLDVLENGLEKEWFESYSTHYAEQSVEQLIKLKEQGEKIQSVGALFRTILRNNLKEYIHNIIEKRHIGAFIEIISKYHSKHGFYPQYLIQ